MKLKVHFIKIRVLVVLTFSAFLFVVMLLLDVSELLDRNYLAVFLLTLFWAYSGITLFNIALQTLRPGAALELDSRGIVLPEISPNLIAWRSVTSAFVHRYRSIAVLVVEIDENAIAGIKLNLLQRLQRGPFRRKGYAVRLPLLLLDTPMGDIMGVIQAGRRQYFQALNEAD